MASSAETWLRQLTELPTASGREEAVVAWVRRWAKRRPEVRLSEDDGGNLLLTLAGKRKAAPVLAVAHMDHPAFVITDVSGREAAYEFRGGVRPEYFEGARVVVLGRDGEVPGRVLGHDPGTRTGKLRVSGEVAVGDLARWRFRRTRVRAGIHAAPACDDLAGCAAALAALDRARPNPSLTHFGVLLTRAEEMGFVGALHAARTGTVPGNARLLSIEASRASADAPMGSGPVIRVGDASTVFDHDLTNRISRVVAVGGLRHQRKLMAGGSCEATAFGGYGYRAAGLCLPLGNYHNMGNLDAVELGQGEAVPMLEEVSLDDFHGLVDLLLVAAEGMDGEFDLRERLDRIYEEGRHLLGRDQGRAR